MRNISLNIVEQLFATETAEVFLPLIEITHPDLATPIRVVRNTEAITHNGNQYEPHPFELQLPRDSQERPPRAQLTFDVIAEPEVRAFLRSIQSPPRVRIVIIAASAPDTILAGPWDFMLKRRTLNNKTVSGELTVDDEIGRPYPEGKLDPGTAPGLFN